ncbi:MAG: hypothetical protein C5B53_00040 [Candidatus Melainabacteria bacterium]|nr:MAG: hypothetical protein C5B53_00040 [Candidatus Melainabacteria bacterium]
MALAATGQDGFDALWAGETTTAIKILSQPNSSDAISSKETCSRYIGLAAALVMSDKFAEAAPIVQHLCKDQFPNQTQWIAYEMENLGFLFELKGRFAEAESLYRRALEIGKHSYGSCQFKYQLAEFYKLRGKQELAKQFLDEADKDGIDGQIFGGSIAAAYKEGANFFQKCFRRGLACEKAGEGSTCFLLYGAAVHDAALRLPKDANSAHLLTVMANSYQNEQRYTPAIKTYDKALAILKALPALPEETMNETKLGLATALDFSGNPDKAAEIYFSIPTKPKALARTLKEWAKGYRHIERARSSGDSELERKAQILYDRAAGLTKGSRQKIHATMPPL